MHNFDRSTCWSPLTASSSWLSVPLNSKTSSACMERKTDHTPILTIAPLHPTSILTRRVSTLHYIQKRGTQVSHMGHRDLWPTASWKWVWLVQLQACLACSLAAMQAPSHLQERHHLIGAPGHSLGKQTTPQLKMKKIILLCVNQWCGFGMLVAKGCYAPSPTLSTPLWSTTEGI